MTSNFIQILRQLQLTHCYSTKYYPLLFLIGLTVTFTHIEQEDKIFWLLTSSEPSQTSHIARLTLTWNLPPAASYIAFQRGNSISPVLGLVYSSWKLVRYSRHHSHHPCWRITQPRQAATNLVSLRFAPCSLIALDNINASNYVKLFLPS